MIVVQSGLQPDSGERSEAYLRAILLSLNPPISPGENPAAPPAWNGPPREIITASNLLYASLLMSLLAAFVAMLGKQWLNRYLSHTGGSMTERSGDRQRKFDGLKKWPFRFFIEGLPIILQIALILLACGLSRYMWSVNTSVARVIISFTAFGFLFYIGIVVAGTSSYDCPFQTPVSLALRHLKDSGITGKISTTLSPSNFTNLLLRVGQAFASSQQGLAQGIQRFRRPSLLPVTALPLLPQNCPVLRLDIWNFEALRQNADDAGCVCWVLRYITEPEAIDSAIRLAGSIRWFNGDSNHEPPFDLIVSTFEACFDSFNQVYPGMRDRAYFSARAIFQIHIRAMVQSNERALEYPIPTVSSSSVPPTDPDLHHLINMLECNSTGRHRPTFYLPEAGTHTHTHSLWMSNLFVDLTRVGPNPSINSYESYLSVAVTNNLVMIANILLMWYMFLGGYVGEETPWIIDKSYATVGFIATISMLNTFHASDFLEDIISHLSARISSLIADGRCPKHLHYLLEFFGAWEERPIWLTPMAYHWCATISEAAERLSPGTMSQPLSPSSPFSRTTEEEFSQIGTGCDLFRLGDAFPHASGLPQILPLTEYVNLLPLTLKIGFRLLKDVPSALHLNHTPHHDHVFEAIFSSDDDEVIADAVSVWIPDDAGRPSGSFARYLAKRVERATPFSPRLRRVSTCALERPRDREGLASTPEAVRLLNRLDVEVDNTNLKRAVWGRMLISAVRSPAGLEGLSRHYWCLLDELVLAGPVTNFISRDMEVMRSLEGAECWEKLEIWMTVMWKSLPVWTVPTPSCMRDIEQVTLKLLLRRPSAIPRFEVLCVEDSNLQGNHRERLRKICGEALEEQPRSNPRPSS